MEKIKEEIKEINKIEMLHKYEDGTKQYALESNEGIDLRKKLFSELSKKDIIILEMKKEDSTLEDAFMKLIERGEK